MREAVDRVLDHLIGQGDLDALVREVDDRCDKSDWEGLLRLRDRCRRAPELGRQLWPAASLAEYRLALEAPGEWAGQVIVDGAGRFALGPLPEVAASTHTWDELADSIPDGPLMSVTAHERVVRGEDLTSDLRAGRAARAGGGVFEIPLRPEPWEPDYPVATYEAHGAYFPMPTLPTPVPVELPLPAAESTADSDEARGLYELAVVWVTQSNGRCSTVGVTGDVLAAIATLGPPRARVVELTAGEAIALMAWTAASGGAHGRRRGMAAGRALAWAAAATLAGLETLEPDNVGEAITELRWYAWDAAKADTGWRFRLAVEDPVDGLAWAVSAADDT